MKFTHRISPSRKLQFGWAHEKYKEESISFSFLGLHGQEYNVLFNFMQGRNELKAFGYSKNKTSTGFSGPVYGLNFVLLTYSVLGFIAVVFRESPSIQRSISPPFSKSKSESNKKSASCRFSCFTYFSIQKMEMICSSEASDCPNYIGLQRRGPLFTQWEPQIQQHIFPLWRRDSSIYVKCCIFRISNIVSKTVQHFTS